MKTPINIYTTALSRLYDDGLVTDKEYKSIMDRITAQRIAQRIAERVEEKNG